MKLLAWALLGFAGVLQAQIGVYKPELYAELKALVDAGATLNPLQLQQWKVQSELHEAENKNCMEPVTKMTTNWIHSGWAAKRKTEELTAERIQEIKDSVAAINAKKLEALDEPRILNLEELAKQYGDKVIQEKFASIKVIKGN